MYGRYCSACEFLISLWLIESTGFLLVEDAAAKKSISEQASGAIIVFILNSLWQLFLQ